MRKCTKLDESSCCDPKVSIQFLAIVYQFASGESQSIPPRYALWMFAPVFTMLGDSITSFRAVNGTASMN
jgi:hypothetical protein